MKLLYTTLLLFVLQNIWAQKTLKVENLYYYFSDPYSKQDTLVNDTVYTSSFDFTSSGKLEEHYDYCHLRRDTIIRIDSTTGKAIRVIQNKFHMYETGAWKHYNHTGKLDKITYYDKGFKRLFVILPNDADTIRVTQDSACVNLSPSLYSSSNFKYRYVIRRTPHNQYLIVHFPILFTHNHWLIYRKKKTLQELYWLYEDNDGYVSSFAVLDHPARNINYFDFGKLPRGTYYVYYRPNSSTYYLQEIVLMDD